MANIPNIISPISVLHEILLWSSDRPMWQRDALRRLISKEILDDTDKIELENLCRQAPGALAANGKLLVPNPLAQDDLPPAPNAQMAVSLEYLDNLTGVNRLPSEQKVTFGSSPGLTMIYGDNGTGKSGYVRVIKKACRSRGAPPVIQPDAFAGTHPKPACDIGIRTSAGSSTVKWVDGIAADEILGNVFVFDSSAASHYLQVDGPASFTPYGLDILPRLVRICDAISENLKKDVRVLEGEITEANISLGKYPNTTVGAALSKLNEKTKLTDVTLLAGLSDAEKKRLAELQAILAADPKKKAQETRACKNRVDAFKIRIVENGKVLTEQKIRELKECFENVEVTAQAAKASAQNRFEKGVLVGTGTELWRAMWEAARTFSTEMAYPRVCYPQTEPACRCVLCQRPFGDDIETSQRMQSFEAFCNEHIQKAAKAEANRLLETQKPFSEKSALKTDYDKIAADLDGLAAEEAKRLSDFVLQADQCLTAIKECIEKGTWTDTSSVSEPPEDILTELSESLETRARTAESVDDPNARAVLQKERDELCAKLWLDSMKVEVENQITRYLKIKTLRARVDDTKTIGITAKNSELTKRLITEAYCKRFSEEINALGIRTVQVRLEELKGTKGKTEFGIRLIGAKGRINIQEIVSEGEQRCISVAAFLAELSQSSHQSALVFDDPVCSLDHHFRSTIAARLVKEAGYRQVIVFTHDAVFLNDLITEADNNNTPKTTRFLQWDKNRPGWTELGLPWDCKSPEDRLEKLRQEQRALAETWQPIPNEDQKTKMFQLYGRLRNTVECVIEKVVFADVVARFRSYIDLKKDKLHRVIGFNQTEFDEIQRLFKKCCDITDAHDHPANKQAATPSPHDLATDIEATDALLKSIRARQKNSK